MIAKIIIVLFVAWISFVPEYVQLRSWLGVRLFLLAVFLALVGASKPSGRRPFDRSDWPLWLFIFCCSFGTLSAVDLTLAARTYSSLALAALFAFYIGKAIMRAKGYFTAFATALSFCGIIVSGLGLLEVIFRYNPLYAPLIPNPYYLRNITDVIARPMSTLYNPIPLATYLIFTIPFGIFLAKSQDRRKVYVAACSVVLSSICLFLIFSRASFAGAALMYLCYLFLSGKRRLALKVFLLIVIILAVLSFAPYPFSRLSIKGIGAYAGGFTDGGRIIRMQMTWEMLQHHPFFGVGMNNFRVLFPQFYPFKAQIPFLLQEVRVPESMYLALLAETGLAGAFSFLLMVAVLIVRRVRAFIRGKAGRETILCLCIFPAMLTSMAGYELLYWFTPCVLFFLACGFLAGRESS